MLAQTLSVWLKAAGIDSMKSFSFSVMALETIAEKPNEKTAGLKADGICGPETWAAIAEEIRKMPMVSYDRKTNTGSIGWHVTLLQAFLNYHGEDLDADGEFGPLTQEALLNFQSCK